MGHESWLDMQPDGGAVEFDENMFFNYSPMVLESSCYTFEKTDVDHAAAFHSQGKVPSASPLGLTLRKTPSLLTMFESKLFKEDRSPSGENGTRKRSMDLPSSKVDEQSYEKLKASNFGASFLKIGTWQRVRRFEGDLVVKCYFAKKKLVWEVLEGALKSKIEIQWCDIMGIRAQVQDPNQPGLLEVELSQPPMFYHESDPKPRKHTCWQPCPDFTGGQALSIRRHYVTFPPGTLDRHYKKLLQCDRRLSQLSLKPFPTLESPYFPSHYSDFSTLSFEPSGFMLHDYQGQGVKAAPGFIIPSHSITKPSTRVNELPPSRPTFSGYNTYNCHYNPMDIEQWNYHGTDELQLQKQHSQILSSHPPASGAIYDIEKHLLSDTQLVPFDEDTVLATVRSMCSLLDYSSQATSNNGTNSTEIEYEYNGCSESDNSMQMENCWYDEMNRFSSSEYANSGSCFRPFNDELSVNWPYF